MTPTRRSTRRPLGALVGAALILAGLLPATVVRVALATVPVFINEIHYDNSGTDADESIEIAGPAGTSLTGWSIVLYNGATGLAYDTDALSGTILDAGGGFGAAAISYPSNGIQNGAPDGIALVNGTTVVQFLSYEGAFTAGDGPAVGMTSADIGVSETGSEPLGRSLQLVGTGITYEDFTWQGPTASASFGTINAGQTFGGGPAAPVINEFSASTTGTDVEYVEVFGSPSTDLSALTILEIEGDTTGAGVIDEVISVGATNAGGFWLGTLPANTLENGTLTLMLVEGFSGTLSADLDTDNDGALETTPWTAIVDAVAVNDGGAGDRTYGVPLGPNYDGLSPFAPGGASRIPDGSDTDLASDWVRNDFDLAGIPGFSGTPVVGEALNSPGAPNELFVPPVTGECGDDATLIHDVQGSGMVSPLVGVGVFIEGVVVGDFQNNAEPDDGDLNGFYVQEEDEDADSDPATSEGVFVFAPGSPDVSAGEQVRVVGTVTEFSTSGGASLMTELSGVGGVLVCLTSVPLPAATLVTLPVPAVTDLERYEGMLVTFPQALAISEYFNFDRFNEVVLTVDRQHQPTAVEEPGTPAADGVALANRLGRITLDDGRSTQNTDPVIHPDGAAFNLAHRFRGGDTVQGVTGVIDETFGVYRIQPTQGGEYSVENPRPTQPEDVGGSLKVASFNVLNYFTTIDAGPDICGPLANQECRGADTPGEFARQRTKIIAALAEIDADVVGLIEIENHPSDVPTADLVSGLNDAVGADTYAYVATGAIGPDAIRVALIYKPAVVSKVGDYAILDSSIDPRFDETRSRPPLAQTFVEHSTGGVFTVAVNHLKSKGSDCGGPPDDDPQQGNCNGTRTLAAQALVDWLAGDPTASGDRDVLIMGDLNAYDKEAPVDAVRAGADDASNTSDDFTDLISAYQGESAYSFVFDGQLGYLDHALASSTVVGQVTGTTVWHINADEPDLLDYDTTFKSDAQDALFESNAFRSSDHDPVIVGLDLVNLDVDFGPFAAPVADPPDTSDAKAGSVVSVRFGLDGDHSFDSFFGVPQTYRCGMPGADRAAAQSAGSSGFRFDEAADRYVFAWKSMKTWAASCRSIEFVLDDGTYRTASVEFRK